MFTLHLLVLRAFRTDEMQLFKDGVQVIVCEFETFWVIKLCAHVARNIKPEIINGKKRLNVKECAVQPWNKKISRSVVIRKEIKDSKSIVLYLLWLPIILWLFTYAVKHFFTQLKTTKPIFSGKNVTHAHVPFPLWSEFGRLLQSWFRGKRATGSVALKLRLNV